MTFTFSQPRRITPEESSPWNTLLSNALKNYEGIAQAKFAPQQMQADIQQKQAASQKNMMMAHLLQSLMGGQSGQGDEQAASQDGGNGMGSDLKPAILKGLLGIDPYLQSPQQAQNLKISGELQSQANKNNLSTGSADISREFLQDKVSMPEQYMGALGSLSMTKDMAAAKLGDKEAKERLIRAAVAEKLVPEYSGFQLLSQGQKATVSALKHQQEAIRQGWPLASKTLTNNLPPELQKEAERKHNAIVKEVNRSREQFFKSGGKERPNFSNAEQKEIQDNTSRADAEATAEAFGTTPEKVLEAQSMGVKTAKEFKEFLEWSKQ